MPLTAGDGGLDGQVIIDGEHWLIQAKRYSRAVSPAHVEDFLTASPAVRPRRGLFIHTGRTGKLFTFARRHRVCAHAGNAYTNDIAGQDVRQYL